MLEGAKDADIVLVEGQGSINHPGYSGVTLGLLHGSCPDALLLCHQSSREYIGDYRKASSVKISPLQTYVKWYEEIGGMVHPTKTIGICLNTYDLDDATAQKACADAERETGLPASDPVRFVRVAGRERRHTADPGQGRQAGTQWEVARELRRRFKKRLDAEGIEIPVPQRSIELRVRPGGGQLDLPGIGGRGR